MKPIAFRIKDFKSIKDSGICRLSTDGITVLAGENESGKTAILSALRDFDLPIDSLPETQDYLPDDDLTLAPKVSICFGVDWNNLFTLIEADELQLSLSLKTSLSKRVDLWITRDLSDNQFYFDKDLEEQWKELNCVTKPDSDQDAPDSDSALIGKFDPASAEEVLATLYQNWPKFFYFDAFDDILPRQISFAKLRPVLKPLPAPNSITAQGPASTLQETEAPQIVLDFLKLARVDLEQIKKIENNEKLLTNYLESRNGTITGDFLSFWRRSAPETQLLLLRVAHHRNSAGELMLSFYVKDTSDQYVDQRSRGFRWFLSFYIRLAASRADGSERPYILLIDEPGSFLHARAQRDVLALFENRIVDRDTVIYSTHSPYLIPANKLHRLKVIIKSSSGGTHVADKLSDSELSKDEFSDTLSPILTAIGIDIREQLKFVGKSNIVVEGLSDFLYLHAWRKLLPDSLAEDLAIFPCTGATTTVLLASLFIGWDLHFIVALDNDDQGHEAKKDLIRDMGVLPTRIVQQKDGNAIEDLLSATDFTIVLNSLDTNFKLEPSEKPGKALKRLRISKVIAAKQFADLVSSGAISPNRVSSDSVSLYLKQLSTALAVQ